MKNGTEPLQDRLRVVRNLTVSTYLTLLNGGTLREELTDQHVAQKLNSLVFKVRTRYDSLNVLVQTVKDGTKSDGAIALAESIIAHVSMIHELLSEAGFEEIAEPYASVCKPVIASYLSETNFAKAEPDRKFVNESMQIPHRLKTLAPAAVVYWFSVMLAERYAKATQVTHADGLTRIVREITFPPEYQQAGLSILNYFATVLNDKYPDIPVMVSIQQEPNHVTLIITLPDGSQDKVTKTLNDYGLVVTGKIDVPPHLSSTPI